MDNPFRPTYKDRWLQVILIPIMGFLYRHIGEPSSLITLLRQPIYYLDVAIAIVSVYLIWQFNKKLIQQIDKRLNWFAETSKRLAIQCSLNLGFTWLYVITVTFIYNDLIIKRPSYFDITIVFLTDIPIASLIVIVINLIYAIMYVIQYYESLLKEKTDSQISNGSSPKNLLVEYGSSKIPLSIEQIAYVLKVGEQAVVVSFDNKNYTVDYSLDELSSMLPAYFYRINRQVLASIKSIKEVTHEKTGKINITFDPPISGQIISVSKNKAAKFRSWIQLH